MDNLLIKQFYVNKIPILTPKRSWTLLLQFNSYNLECKYKQIWYQNVEFLLAKRKSEINLIISMYICLLRFCGKSISLIILTCPSQYLTLPCLFVLFTTAEVVF